MFSGYVISDPEFQQPLQTPVVNSLTLGITKYNLQVVCSVLLCYFVLRAYLLLYTEPSFSYWAHTNDSY
jgi:hypothetical protein